MKTSCRQLLKKKFVTKFIFIIWAVETVENFFKAVTMRWNPPMACGKPCGQPVEELWKT